MKTYSVILLLAGMLLAGSCKSLNQKTSQTVENTPEQISSQSEALIPVDTAVRIGTLPNGMTYYIRQNQKPENKVEMRLAVNAGSILEDDDQLGLAHFMEHMNFNGLKHFPKNELVHFLQRMGIRFGPDLNAYTSFDETVYMLPIPLDSADNLDKGLLVLHDWAYFANLDPEEIEKERGVVLEEYRLGLGAERRMWNKTLPILLKNSRYAERLPIGKKEILETFPHETLKRFHRDWYRPDLEAVIIVGDIDPDEVEKKLREMFADIPAAENPRERKYYTVPNHDETLISIADDPEAMDNSVLIYYKDHEDYQPDRTVNDYRDYLATRLFTTMLNNRLRNIQEEADPPFSFASTYHGQTWARTKEAFQIYSFVDPGKRLEALETLLTEAKKAGLYGFTASELDQAKKELFKSIEEAYANRHTTHSRNYVNQYVKHYLSGEPIPSVEWEYEMYKKLLPEISLEEVNALSKKYIHDDNRVIVIHGKKDASVPSITEEDVRAILQKVDTAAIEQPEEKTGELVLMKEKPEPGVIEKKTRDDVLGTVTYHLSNGARVTVKKTDFKEDEILLSAFKYGGKSLLDTATLHKTAFAFSGVTEAGVNGLKKKDLRKILAGKKVKLNFRVGDADQSNSGNTLLNDLETALQLNYLHFTALNKDPEAFNSWKQRMAAYYGNILNSPVYRFQIAYYDYLFQNDPRYTGIIPTPEKLAQADYDLAYEKFREFYDGGTDFHFYIVGNFDEDRMEDYIRTYIGGLPTSKLPGKYIDHGFHALKGHHEFTYYAGTDPKSWVIITYYGETEYSPEEKIKLDILAKILTNKLIDKLREEVSGVYGVGARASMEKIPHPAYWFTISFPCGPENAKTLAAMAENELKSLVENGPSDDDLLKVTKSLLVKFDEDVKTNQFWLTYLSDTDYNRLDPHRIEQYKDFIQSLTPEDIRRTAEKYLKNPPNKLSGFLYPETNKE